MYWFLLFSKINPVQEKYTCNAFVQYLHFMIFTVNTVFSRLVFQTILNTLFVFLQTWKLLKSFVLLLVASIWTTTYIKLVFEAATLGSSPGDLDLYTKQGGEADLPDSINALVPSLNPSYWILPASNPIAQATPLEPLWGKNMLCWITRLGMCFEKTAGMVGWGKRAGKAVAVENCQQRASRSGKSDS